MRIEKRTRNVSVEDRAYVFTKAELQELIDFVFEMGIRIHNGDFKDKNREKVATWIADTLRMLHIRTKPYKISWGILED